MPQLMHLRSEQATLLELEGDPGTPQQAQDSVEKLRLFSVRTGEQHDIIQVHDAYLPSDAK